MNDPNQTRSFSPDDPPRSEVVVAPELPPHIGRYRVERILGQGGYGIVYLAHDDQLKRLVAIKVPHSHLVAQAAQAEAYLTEARTVANLDHPHIVPVYDVGSTHQFPCFVVSKYVDGTDLAAKLKSDRLTIHQIIELMATVTEALHHAHKQGLVHRDIKPANILLDRNDNPFVTDFGLALREQDIGTGPRFAGTPMYMSPEQARGEGHRVDGRSDIFSLGVVLYEMLTGRRPFRADSQHELLEQITSFEPRPPRQHDEVIPKELDRICLKALSKRASERYSTAKDLADDLRSFLAESPTATKSAITSQQRNESAVVTPVATPVSTRASDSQPIRIVPKGLRSFDAHDADFFLELLPGPRDRDDLPESIRFWKNHIEETDADNTFAVGLIYGPSGCGKSSFVKAGLLPRLSDTVIAVYVEATAAETETRLLNGLRKRCTALSNHLTLKESLAALRRGQGVPIGKKVVIILDQFEQWLHAKKDQQNTELVQALRQCDGGHVQCVVMVRDDFWLAVSRFLRELEIRLVEGQNSALADLFDVDHARKVLAAFGRAFGRLPESAGGKSSDQQAFLTQAVAGLAREGKVISVRLALFAEMMKSKPWTPATLKQVGGIAGVGATFLEETFSAATAPPEHRYHQKAARAVLKALLPDSGTDIKGYMRSYDELLETSGYAARPNDFEELIRILDSEIRLITPTDPEGSDVSTALAAGSEPTANRSDEPAARAISSGDVSRSKIDAQKSSLHFYQLTHDYLVPSLRDWLTRKQKETRKGRAELLLADRAAVWNARPENRQLPSLLQWLQIKAFTSKNTWTSPQRKMIRVAGRVHGLRWGVAIVVALLIGFTVPWIVSSVERHNLTSQIKIATKSLNTSRGIILPPLASFENFPREILLEELQNQFADSETSSKLPLAYALAHFGDVRIEFLLSQLDDAAGDEIGNFLDALGHADPKMLLKAIDAEAAACDRRAAEEQSDNVDNAAWLQKARLASLGLSMGQHALAQNMCQLRPDPIQRTLFIKECPAWCANLLSLSDSVTSIDDASWRSALCLVVGSVSPKSMTPEQTEAWQRLLSEWYQQELDAGTHSASGWALRQWQLPLPPLPVGAPQPSEEQQQQIDRLTADLQQQITDSDAESEVEWQQWKTDWEQDLLKESPTSDEFLTEGLVAHYPLDEVEGTIAANAITDRPSGVYERPGNPEWVPGIFGNALRLDGQGGALNCGDAFAFDYTDAVSYGCWFLADPDGPSSATFFSKYDNSLQQGFVVRILKSKSQVICAWSHHYPDNTLVVRATVPRIFGQWHHLFVTYDGSASVEGVAIFVDSQPVAKNVEIIKDVERNSLSASLGTSKPLQIGIRDKTDRYHGVLDDVRFYARRVTSDEVARLYRAGLRKLVEVPVANRSADEQQRIIDFIRTQYEVTNQFLQYQEHVVKVKKLLHEASWQAGSQWQVKTVGLTMLRMPAGQVLNEDGQAIEVVTDFLISDREVPVGLFQQFIDDPDYPDTEKPQDWSGAYTSDRPTTDHPVQRVSWYDAVLFCNWLSHQEGLAPCYPRTGDDPWRMDPIASGYRLPTGDEWEYACRAGTTTIYSFGDDPSLLVDYAVSASENAAVCGSKMPSGWGLFDMHGNVWEWCFDPSGTQGSLRGGSHRFSAKGIRSGNQRNSWPSSRIQDLGFRVVLVPPASNSE